MYCQSSSLVLNSAIGLYSRSFTSWKVAPVGNSFQGLLCQPTIPTVIPCSITFMLFMVEMFTCSVKLFLVMVLLLVVM